MEIVKVEYQGSPESFSDKGWFNATQAAARFGKRPVDWLIQDNTKEYIEALASILKCEPGSLLKTKKGNNGGTWMYPRLSVPFARWLDVNFGVWCDDQIYKILSGTHKHYDWKKIRHEASSSFKVMNEALKIVREEQRKVSQAHIIPTRLG